MDDELDLSELLDDISDEEIAQSSPTEIDKLLDDEVRDVLDPNRRMDLEDRIFVRPPMAFDLSGECSVRVREEFGEEEGFIEYLRADAIREGFTTKIWREAGRFAQRTAGQPGGALRKVRDLIEEGR